MKSETRLTALRAAQAIAGLVACSPVVTTTPTPAPKPEPCPVVVDRFFPNDPDDYAPEKTISDVPPDVKKCCLDALSQTASEDAKKVFAAHRWTCCRVIDNPRNSYSGVACTPWGPPVPPSLARRLDRRDRFRQA